MSVLTNEKARSRTLPRVDFKREALFLTILALVTFLIVQAEVRKNIYHFEYARLVDSTHTFSDRVRMAADESSAQQICPIVARLSRPIKLAAMGQLPSTAPDVMSRLWTVHSMVGAGIVYIMNQKGDVVASTVDREGVSLTGSSFPFRAYFQESMKGKNFIYPAFGLKTHTRGIYYSSPIFCKDEVTGPVEDITGVFVIKTSVEPLDEIFTSTKDPAFLLTPDGVVLCSTWSEHILSFHPAFRKTGASDFSDDQQYGGKKPEELPRLPFTLNSTYEVINGIQYAVSQRNIDITRDGPVWTLVQFRSTQNWITWPKLLLPATLVVIFYILAGLLYWSLKNRLLMERFTSRESKNSASTFKAIIDGVSETILLFDAETHLVIESNQGAIKLFGYDQKDLSKRKLEELIIPESGDWKSEKLIARQVGETLRMDSRVCPQDGKEFQAETTLHFSLIGDKPCILAVIRDTTEQKRLEKYLIEARDAAEKASAAKSGFLAIMSHELRNPLTAIIGAADLLAHGNNSGQSSNWANVILHSSEHLLQLINDILDYSKIEAGMLKLDPHDFSLHQLAQEVIEIHRILADQKGLYIKLRIDQSVPEWMKADSLRIRQVLGNLLSNSIKFTESGGVGINIRAEPLDDGKKIRLFFQVDDTGIGIPEEKKSILFQPFIQGDSSTTRRYGGTGLGLAICKKLTEQMGGEIYFDSKEGEGTKFRFHFLAEKIRQIGTPQPKNQEINTTFAVSSPLHIAVAEDDPLNIKVLQGALRRLGYSNFRMAATGKEMVDIIREDPSINTILMDIRMPEMDGVEATTTIHTLCKGKSRPYIIGLSANAFDEDRQKCLGAGMDDYITKPVRMEALMNGLRKASASLSLKTKGRA